MPPESPVTERPSFQRPFLKWAGNKYQILRRILQELPAGNRLIEPFAGSGAVFLNTDYDRYLISDINRDLITLFKTLKDGGEEFIRYAARYFRPKNNSADAYYRLRERFNTTGDVREKSALFLYLNRHGYNGLCRYNASHRFNVPFGRYKRPYFPATEMRAFHAKARRAKFVYVDFRQAMARARRGNVVYADPPYVPLNDTAYFTSYSSTGFDLPEQEALARVAEDLAGRGVPVLISNHDTPFTRQIYRNASITRFPVKRSISCKAEQRNEVSELLALFAGRG
jgi:DNA adenine methylase